MALIASDSGNTFVRAPKGVHPAICYSVVDLGTQQGVYEGRSYERHQVFISWELPKQMYDFDGVSKPIAVSEFYTLSLNEKANLRHMLEGWRSKSFLKDELIGFDIKKILGKPCLINVIEKNDRSRVGSVMPANDEAKGFEQFNDTIYFSFEESSSIPENIPDGIKKIIMKSTEYNENGQMNDWPEPDYPDEPSQHGDDDIPF